MSYDNRTTVGRHVGQDHVKLNATFDAYATSAASRSISSIPDDPTSTPP